MLHLCVLLCPQQTVAFFFPSINVCRNVGNHFCMYFSMDSTHGQHLPLFSLLLWCTPTTCRPQLGNDLPSIPSSEWPDFSSYHEGTTHLKAGSEVDRKVCRQLSLTKFSFIVLWLESVPYKSMLLKESDVCSKKQLEKWKPSVCSRAKRGAVMPIMTGRMTLCQR